MNKHRTTTFIAWVVALIGVLSIPLFVSHAAAATTPEVGALDYPLEKAVCNQWLILAAKGWPAMTMDTISQIVETVPVEEQSRFSSWTKATVKTDLLPNKMIDIPYLKGYGFVHVAEVRGYRVRLREARGPVSVGCTTRAIVMAVEPLSGSMPVPTSHSTFVDILQQFLSPKITETVRPAVDAYTEKFTLPPVFDTVGGGTFLQAGPKQVEPPIVLYAWTDGKILLIALYEDTQHSDQPPVKDLGPEPSLTPVSPKISETGG